MSDERVAIVGGGISGLATAFYLGRLGIRSTVIEKASRLGGLIRTEVEQGCHLEAGPDSYIATKTSVSELASELGLAGEIIGSNDAARRVFIVRNGALIPLPAGMSMMVPGKLLPALRSPLFSARTKAGFAAERFHRPQHRAGDFSVGELVEDHFGSELLQYVADPLLAGVYGGGAASLSAPSVLPRFVTYEQRYGSLIRGARSETGKASHAGSLFRSFREGMQTLVDGLTQAIGQSTCVRRDEVISIHRDGNCWTIRLSGGQLSTRQVVLACPAWVCARLTASAIPDLAAEFREIPYSSAILVTLLYQASALRRPLDGFGFLVPDVERTTIAACTWINTKFPGRIANGQVALRAFVVAEQAKRLETISDESLTQLVTDDMKRFMGIDAEPRTARIHRWPRSMPQYIVGHAAHVGRIHELVAQQPGLRMVGNAYEGVGVPDCVRLARHAAEGIASEIKSL